MEIDKILSVTQHYQNGVNCDGLDHNITKSTLDKYYSSYLGLADRRYRSMVHDKQANMTLDPFTTVTHPLILHFSASHYHYLDTSEVPAKRTHSSY
jgi:hypothetical protein